MEKESVRNYKMEYENIKKELIETRRKYALLLSYVGDYIYRESARISEIKQVINSPLSPSEIERLTKENVLFTKSSN